VNSYTQVAIKISIAQANYLSMAKYKLIFLFIVFQSLSANAQKEAFVKFENKTWQEIDGFAGTTIVFYKTSNGLLKAIRQINGSGIPVIASDIYDIEVAHNKLSLINGRNLSKNEVFANPSLEYEVVNDLLVRNGDTLRSIFQGPILFSWTANGKGVLSKIDVSKLSEIPIGRNEIYKEEDVIEIQMAR